MDRPVIFLSAVSAEFRELRQLLHDSFKTHFHVITQEDTLHKFPGGDVRQLLSDAIDGAHAVLHLAGAGFGSTAAAPFPEMPGFLCSWTQYEYYYAHSFDADPGRRKQIFAIVCGPTLRSPTFTEKDDSILTAARKAPLQEAHCQRIFSGKFDATPLARFPRTVNHGQPINDNAATLRAAIDICAQLATRQPAFQSACALVQVSLQDQLQPLLDTQLRIEKKQKRLLQLSLCTLAVLALIGGGIFLVTLSQNKQEQAQALLATQQTQGQAQLATQLSQVSEALSRLQQQTNPKTDPFSGWSQERLETALAQQLQLKVEDLRAILSAGRTSLDALVSAQALLASGKSDEAGKKFDEVITQDQAQAKAVNQRLMQAYAGKAQIAFDQADFKTTLSYRQKAAALVDKEKAPLAWADAQKPVTFTQLYTAEYSQAEPLMREILRINEEKRGPTAQETATALNNLANLLQATNRLAEAEPLMRRALEIDEGSSGKDHPDVAIRLNNLATMLYTTNRLAEAEPLMRRALEIDEASYGKTHPDVARDLNNLALLLQATNRLAEAEPLMRRALEIGEVSSGKDHPDVAIRLNNLAQLLQATNRLAEAEPLMRRALEIDEASYGKTHPDVARDLNNLALLLQATNRLAEAEPLMRRALEIDEASYGKTHPDVARDLNNLASLLKATNRLAEAEPLSRRNLGILLRFQAKTGHRNPNVIVGLGNYLSLSRSLNLPDSEIHIRLATESRKAGLEPAAFEALWAEVLEKNYTGPYLVTVNEAVAGGQGIALGIQAGDVILRYHGQAITSMAQLIQLTGEVKEEAIPLEIQRGKEILKLTAKPGKLGVKIQNVMPLAASDGK